MYFSTILSLVAFYILYHTKNYTTRHYVFVDYLCFSRVLHKVDYYKFCDFFHAGYSRIVELNQI